MPLPDNSAEVTAPMNAETWETNEVYNRIANDKGHLAAALRCTDDDQLRRAFEGAHHWVDYSLVDWGAVWEWVNS
jgi:hypothetical protein